MWRHHVIECVLQRGSWNYRWSATLPHTHTQSLLTSTSLFFLSESIIYLPSVNYPLNNTRTVHRLVETQRHSLCTDVSLSPLNLIILYSYYRFFQMLWHPAEFKTWMAADRQTSAQFPWTQRLRKPFLPAGQRWHLSHPVRTRGKWWWTLHPRRQGCASWHAGPPVTGFSLHVSGWSVAPASCAGNSAWWEGYTSTPVRAEGGY